MNEAKIDAMFFVDDAKDIKQIQVDGPGYGGLLGVELHERW